VTRREVLLTLFFATITGAGGGLIIANILLRMGVIA